MKFPYREYISELPGTSDFRLIVRPIVTIRIAGTHTSARWDALVDTGADETLLPLKFAELLGVELDGATGQASGIAGGRLTIHYGDVGFLLERENVAVEWIATVGFVDFNSPDDEVVILGHHGCLDFFTATFDGERAELDLSPNSQLPTLNGLQPD